jgi:phosphatidylinositol alpha-mannosyltransferase
MAGAAVFCSPALGGESFGLVLAEAMAAGTPVVASDLPGYRAALDGAGVLVPPGDAAALATALRDLLATPRRRAELVTAGRARARALSIETLATRYLTIYESVANRTVRR